MRKTITLVSAAIALSGCTPTTASLTFDPKEKAFIEVDKVPCETRVYKEISPKIRTFNSKILRFEDVKMKEHRLYELEELRPTPIQRASIEEFKEMEIIDISREIDVPSDDFDYQDGKLYTTLFFKDKKELTYESEQKLKKITKSLEGIDHFSARIESNYYSLENDKYNYNKSIANGQRLRERLLLNTYVLENDVDIIPFGDKNKLCVKNIPECLEKNTRIGLFITSKR